MNELSIHIGWEYFLGVIGTLIGIAYYTNGRLTKLETSMDWVKDALSRLNARFEDRIPTNTRSQANKPAARRQSQ
jgi:hypothetical protein